VISARWALAVLAGAAVLLAACGGSNTPKSKTTATTARTNQATSTTLAPATSSSAVTTTTTAAATAACDHITAAPGQGQGAAGTITGTVTVTNAGSSSCTVDGYPTLALLSGSGAPLPVTMVDGLSVTVTPQAGAAASSVTLAPSGTAQFAYQFSDVPVGSETSCPTSEMATTTMPGATAASPPFALAIDPCDNGTIRVSPVYSSS
jgi:hypothetical protein